MTKKPLHFEQTLFPVEDDCLQVGGIPLTRLALRVEGSFYAYDRRLLTERVAHLRRNLPGKVHLHYAMKANPMPAVVQHLSSLVDGLDVASAGELKVALDAGVVPEEISFAGPGKTLRELESAVAAGIVINLESFREMEAVSEIGHRFGIRPRAAVRVNPDFELKSSGMKMGGGPKQFGVDAEQVPLMLQRLSKLDIEFRGFHIFSGSQNLNAQSIIEAQENAVRLGIRLAADAPVQVATLNIGGGFGIPYFPGETPLDLAPIGERMEVLLDLLQNELPGANLVIELGRYLVGEAGIYVTRIVDRKVSRGQVFLVTEGGLNHHLAASGNFGQVIRKNYPVAVGNRMQGEEREIASVVGPLCTPLDILADKMDLPKAEIGDLVVVFQSGAYGLTASPGAFLSHPGATEVLV
ncbi:MAG: pyridoxal-dependent decarboxylase, exosortase A system-associated [Burkholderiales bacterium]|nr:pyridoxal-dependent decarboxylase, exosortase A system-associated [Burkholderiales bacterium]